MLDLALPILTLLAGVGIGLAWARSQHETATSSPLRPSRTWYPSTTPATAPA